MAGGTFEPKAILGPGTYVLEAEVEDSGELIDIDTIEFIVEPDSEDKKVAPGHGLRETESGTIFRGHAFEGKQLGESDFARDPGEPFSIQGTDIHETGTADTIVLRLDEASVPSIPGSDTIDIELVALQLVSVEPIDLGAGLDDHFVTLQSIHGGPASLGMMEITFDDANGGTFDSFFDVFFDIRIGAVDGPIIISDELRLESSNVPWSRTPEPDALLIKGVNHLLSPEMDNSEDFFPTGIFNEINSDDPPTIQRVSQAKVIKVVGGEQIPIETTSLLLANVQIFSWMIPLILSVLGIGLFVVSRKSD